VFEPIENRLTYAGYCQKTNTISLDLKKLSKLVEERLMQARSEGVNFEDPTSIWIAKFSSLVSHETIHETLARLEGIDTCKTFDKLNFRRLMGKTLNNNFYLVLWSDALESCPCHDTWFNTIGHFLCAVDSTGIIGLVCIVK